jgi:hypothetical protein
MRTKSLWWFVRYVSVENELHSRTWRVTHSAPDIKLAEIWEPADSFFFVLSLYFFHTTPWSLGLLDWGERCLEDGCLLGCDPRQDDGDSKDLWNVGKTIPDYTVLQPRRQPSSYSPPWKPQILLNDASFHIEQCFYFDVQAVWDVGL